MEAFGFYDGKCTVSCRNKFNFKVTRADFHADFQERFFWERKKNYFEFLICYYSHLEDTEKNFFEEI